MTVEYVKTSAEGFATQMVIRLVGRVDVDAMAEGLRTSTVTPPVLDPGGAPPVDSRDGDQAPGFVID